MTPTDPLTFLRAVMDGVHEHSLCAMGPNGRFVVDSFHADPVALHARSVALSIDGFNVWLGAHGLSARPAAGRGDAGDVAQVSALHADLDWRDPDAHADAELPSEEQVRALVGAFPLAPTFVVESGHGLQCWWKLASPVTPDRGLELLERLHVALRGSGLATDRHDLASVLRVPGTHNLKVPEEPVPVRVISANANAYVPEYLGSKLPEKPKAVARVHGQGAVSPVTASPVLGGVSMPSDEFMAAHNGGDVLEAAGWEFHHEDSQGRHYTRPGKDTRQGSSACVYADNGRTTIFTTSSGVLEEFTGRRMLTPWQLHVALHHGGDFTAASVAWRKVHPLVVAPVLTADRFLPDSFWAARPSLEAIRQAARARRVGPDAVLGSVLVRVAALTPHIVELPPTVGSAIGLTTFVCLVGRPSSGKSAAARMAAELLPVPVQRKASIPDMVPIGSGEGFVDILFDEVEEPDPSGKKGSKKVKRQTKNAAIFHIDEGEALGELSKRSGSTLMPTLRTAFSHGTLGNANATQERKRIVAGGNYVYGMTMGLQPAKAGPLLSDDDGGTPQRFLWLMATDPTAPNDPPLWPAGGLVWKSPLPADFADEARATGRLRLLLPEAVRDAVDADRLGALREQDGDSDTGLAHQMLVRLKVAALLAILDLRTSVREDDWELAEVVVETSHRVRAYIEDVLRHEAATNRRGKAIAQGEAAAIAAEVVEDAAVLRAAASAARRTWKHHADHEDGLGCKRSCLSAAMTGAGPKPVAAALELAEAHRWIAPTAGAEGRYGPGPERPPEATR